MLRPFAFTSLAMVGLVASRRRACRSGASDRKLEIREPELGLCNGPVLASAAPIRRLRRPRYGPTLGPPRLPGLRAFASRSCLRPQALRTGMVSEPGGWLLQSNEYLGRGGAASHVFAAHVTL